MYLALARTVIPYVVSVVMHCNMSIKSLSFFYIIAFFMAQGTA